LTRHRPRKDIAANHYLVYVCDANLFEHRLERGKIRVNVVQCCDPHTTAPCLSEHPGPAKAGHYVPILQTGNGDVLRRGEWILENT
jgi:hypothetical protein